MSEKIEIVKSSDNVYADFGFDDADMLQLKAQVAAEIIKIIDRRNLKVVEAADLVGVDPTEISRIRKAKLKPFTIDRLMRIMGRLDRRPNLTFDKVEKSTAHA